MNCVAKQSDNADDVSGDESSAPSLLPFDSDQRYRRSGSGRHLQRSQDSIISLMSSATTSGLGMSQSPLLNRNFHRQSNKRFSARSFFQTAAVAAGQHSSPSSVAERFSHRVSNCSANATTRPFIPLPVDPQPLDLVSGCAHDPFVGRDWLYHELYEILVQPHIANGMNGAVIFGASGTGKTSTCLQLVKDRGNFSQNRSIIWRPMVQDHVLAWHFCQLDDQGSCNLNNFLLNLIAQTARHPDFYAYLEFVAEARLLDPQQQHYNELDRFKAMYTDKLVSLQRENKLRQNVNYLLVIDALDEAEFHKPEFGQSIAAFLLKHSEQLLPNFVKLVVTINSSQLDLLKGLRLHKISLDDLPAHDSVDYVRMRIDDKAALRKRLSPDSLAKFVEHVVAVSSGNLLYLRLTLDLLERGQLALKGQNFKALPTSLGEAFLLVMNLKFQMPARSFDAKIRPIFQLMMASTEKLTPDAIFAVLNAQAIAGDVRWDDFCSSLDVIQDLVVRRKDDSVAFFHPAFREWLFQSHRYSCDPKPGHAMLAISLIRQSGKLLDSQQLQTLCHHLLKAHVYKNVGLRGSLQRASAKDCQLHWINFRADNIRAALCTVQNLHSPNTKVSRLLLLAGADPNAEMGDEQGPQGNPLLCLAVKTGRVDLAALLLEFGADPNLTDSDGSCALAYAARAGNLHLVQLLHQKGAKLSQTDDQEKCPLVHAAVEGRVEVASFMLHCDWPDDGDSGQCWTSKQQAVQQAFVAAAQHGQLQMCQFLHDFGDITIDEPCPVTSETALSIACLKCRSDVVNFLLKSGASLSCAAQGLSRLSPLIRAVEGGCWEIVAAILSRHVDVNAERNEKLETALIKVSQTGHIGIMELLLSRDAQLNSVDAQGRTALCWACVNNKTACASLLLDRGAKISTVDDQGRNPMHYLAQSGSKHIIQLLLDACPNATTMLESCDVSGNQRPLEIAIANQNTEAVLKFLRKGAKLIPDTWHCAKATGADMSRLLLRKLLDDGVVLYGKGQTREAEHRFRYAIRKFDSVYNETATSSQAAQTSVPTTDVIIHRNLESGVDFLPEKDRQLKYQLLLHLARCQRKSACLQQAVATCQQAQNLNPRGIEAHFCHGRCCYEAREYEAARQQLCIVAQLSREKSCRQAGSNCRPSNGSCEFGRAAEDLLQKMNKLDESKTKQWEQGSSDSGNMPDIDSVKV